MFFKLLKYDLRIGILQQYKKLLVTVGIFTAAYVEHWMRIKAYQMSGNGHPVTDTLGNTMMSIFQGMQEFSLTIDRQFRFPAVWMLMYLVLAYFTLYYPYHDLEDSGRNLLLRSGGRYLWWISKCIWNIVTVLLFFLTGWLVIAVFCLLRGVPLSMEISENITYFLDMRWSQFWLYPEKLTMELLLLPVLVMLALNLMQMTLSLFIRPIFSFMVTGMVLLASAYYQTHLLIGNYAMPIRSNRLLLHGINPLYGIGYSLGVIAAAFLVGMIRFKKYDIIRREE